VIRRHETRYLRSNADGCNDGIDPSIPKRTHWKQETEIPSRRGEPKHDEIVKRSSFPIDQQQVF
jgi:hypothetical protein